MRKSKSERNEKGKARLADVGFDGRRRMGRTYMEMIGRDDSMLLLLREQSSSILVINE